MKKILEKQVYHLLSLLVLIPLIWVLARGEVLSGAFLGLSTRAWLILAVVLPIIHQVYVVICWRGELYFQRLSKVFGEKAFLYWGIGFMILFLARPVTILALAAANRATLIIPLWLNIPLMIVLLGITIYMAYSFVNFFGVERALGMDHFEPEEYRNKAFVKEGIFRWSSNAMYTYAFLALWLIALAFQSKAALLGALFNHLYIWVHYYFTEYPDMLYIYGDQ